MAVDPLDFRRFKTFTLIENDNFKVVGEVKYNGKVFLHMSPPKYWALSVYKEMLSCMDAIRWGLSERDVEEIFVMIPDDDPKLFKFETMMGFKPWLKVIDRDTGENFFLMVQPTGDG